MPLSKDLTDSFKERMTQNHDDMDIAFSIMALRTNFWPLAPPTRNFLLPPELLPTVERYEHFGRKLTWLHNYSKNELRTDYTNQKYILMTPADQAAVLLQYNGNDTLSLTELQRATTFSPEILGQVLALLVKAKVLINEEKDQYDLNPGFKSKKIRVNPNLPIKADVKAESSGMLKVVDEDRKYVVQVTIVRILDIKKAIETLLEKECIERVEGSKNPTRLPPALSSIDISVSHIALYGLCLCPRLALPVSRRCVSPVFSLEGLFLRLLPLPAPSPVSKVIPKMLISVAAANLAFNPDDSWDTAEITSPPNAPVVVERPRPETRPVARKNLVTELLRKQQDAATDKAAMIQVLEATRTEDPRGHDSRSRECGTQIGRSSGEETNGRAHPAESRGPTEPRPHRGPPAGTYKDHRRVPEPEGPRAFVLTETQKKVLKENKLNYITRLLNVPQRKLTKNNALKRARTAALKVLSMKEQELVKLLGDALEEGRELRNIQQHKRPDTATALERTSIATEMPPDLYHILEDLLASDPRRLKVGDERERNAPEVDLRLFAPEGTYVPVGKMREDLVTMRRELEELEERLAKEKATGMHEQGNGTFFFHTSYLDLPYQVSVLSA
ncbi:hypothetical protein B0H14DRAFT_2558359 [Mycena olivaceomarginata]|nr:hypothetical protein B0H14DRAFT_2558359 [Mycena olivaceomarginata]